VRLGARRAPAHAPASSPRRVCPAQALGPTYEFLHAKNLRVHDVLTVLRQEVHQEVAPVEHAALRGSCIDAWQGSLTEAVNAALEQGLSEKEGLRYIAQRLLEQAEGM